jgi:neurotransmitter:Na+ symporter, NSS family
MVVYGIQAGDFDAAVAYLFEPDFAEFQGKAGEAILSAMGQAFFSLSLGMGAIMIYGSYLKRDSSIAQNTMIIAGLDTLVALLAGLGDLSDRLRQRLGPDSGPGSDLPDLADRLRRHAGRRLLRDSVLRASSLFAAWTSAISLLEPLVAWLVENLSFSRVRASVLGGFTVWLLGIACLLSLNAWSEVKIFGKGFLDLFDFLTANILLPLGGVLIAIFAGWMLSRASSSDELQMGEGLAYRLWWLLIRYVAPIAVGIVLLNAVGVLEWIGLGERAEMTVCDRFPSAGLSVAPCAWVDDRRATESGSFHFLNRVTHTALDALDGQALSQRRFFTLDAV